MTRSSQGTRLAVVMERLRTRASGRFALDGAWPRVRVLEPRRNVALRRAACDAGGDESGPRNDLGPGRRCLVTGCAGFIGSHLVEALNARGCSVVGVDAFIDNYPRALKERNLARCGGDDGLRFLELDLADAPVEPLLEGIDGVFHLAARPGVRGSWGPTFEAYVRDNVLATQRLFEGAAAQGIRVVYASSSSVYGDATGYPLREDTQLAPVSPYGMTKLAGEVLASTYGRSRGLDAVGLRYFSVYGPRQRPDMAFSLMLRCLLENRPFPLLGSGRQTREFTYVGDVVAATLAAMLRAPAGRVYNVGGGGEISVLESMAVCERIVGRRLHVQHTAPIAGEARRTSADVRRAAADLDWRPTTSLEAGLEAQVGELEGVPAAASAA